MQTSIYKIHEYLEKKKHRENGQIDANSSDRSRNVNDLHFIPFVYSTTFIVHNSFICLKRPNWKCGCSIVEYSCAYKHVHSYLFISFSFYLIGSMHACICMCIMPKCIDFFGLFIRRIWFCMLDFAVRIHLKTKYTINHFACYFESSDCVCVCLFVCRL